MWWALIKILGAHFVTPLLPVDCVNAAGLLENPLICSWFCESGLMDVSVSQEDSTS